MKIWVFPSGNNKNQAKRYGMLTKSGKNG